MASQTDSGSDFYNRLSQRILFNNEDHHASDLFNLSITILSTATLCQLLLLAPSVMERRIQLKWWWRSGGDLSFTWIAWWLVLMPSLGYLLLRVYPLFWDEDTSTLSFQFSFGTHVQLANSFGKVAMVSMSWFLVPTSRHSILLNAMGWDPIHATQLHTSAGTLAVFGGVAHGIYWSYIWMFLEGLGGTNQHHGHSDSHSTSSNSEHEHEHGGGEHMDGPVEGGMIGRGMDGQEEQGAAVDWKSAMNFDSTTVSPVDELTVWHGGGHRILVEEGPLAKLYNNIAPPKYCWDSTILFGNVESFECYRALMNLTGFVAGLCFLMLGVTSLWWVRRHYYRLFYVSHVIFATLGFFALVMHYNPLILYICPGILYYAATAGPTIVQSLFLYARGGIHVRSVHHVPHSGDCVELSISTTLCETTLSTIATQYIRICVPELSYIWHPFTVYSSTTADSGEVQLHIMFRCYGTFTKALSKRLLQPKYPKILLDGLYNGPDRLSQALQHDTVVMVAGGIGIVSYISMMQLLHATTATSTSSFATRSVVLLFISRDEGLIDHVLEQHLNVLVDVERNASTASSSSSCEGVQFQIIIYHTAAARESLSTAIQSTSERLLLPDHDTDDPTTNSTTRSGVAFAPSTMSLAGKSNGIGFKISSVIVFLVIAWGGLWMVWYMYSNLQKPHGSIGTRTYSTFGIMILSLVTPVATTVVTLAASLFLNNYFKEMMKGRPTTVDYNSLTSLSSGADNNMTEEGEGSSTSGSEDDPTTTPQPVVPSSSSLDGGKYQSLKLTDMEHERNVNLLITDKVSNDDEEAVVPNNTCSVLDSSDLETVTTTTTTTNGGGVEVYHRNGRPVMENLLGELLLGFEKPGIFMCGPSRLLESVKTTVTQRTASRCCRLGGTRKFPTCAIYEEGFEV